MSMRRAAVITAAIQTHNLLDKPNANRTEPTRKYQKPEDGYEDNHINLLFTGIILGVIFTILILVCHYCYRYFKKQPEIIYRQHYFNDNTQVAQSSESQDMEQGLQYLHHEEIASQDTRTELTTPDYYKSVSGPPPPYDLVVSLNNEQTNQNSSDSLNVPPPWKEAWAVNNNSVSNESTCNIDNKNCNDEEKEAKDGLITAKVIKITPSRNFNTLDLPTYEASVGLEPIGYI